jgi:hypothetical protein
MCSSSVSISGQGCLTVRASCIPARGRRSEPEAEMAKSLELDKPQPRARLRSSQRQQFRPIEFARVSRGWDLAQPRKGDLQVAPNEESIAPPPPGNCKCCDENVIVPDSERVSVDQNASETPFFTLKKFGIREESCSRHSSDCASSISATSSRQRTRIVLTIPTLCVQTRAWQASCPANMVPMGCSFIYRAYSIAWGGIIAPLWSIDVISP